LKFEELIPRSRDIARTKSVEEAKTTSRRYRYKRAAIQKALKAVTYRADRRYHSFATKLQVSFTIPSVFK